MSAKITVRLLNQDGEPLTDKDVRIQLKDWNGTEWVNDAQVEMPHVGNGLYRLLRDRTTFGSILVKEGEEYVEQQEAISSLFPSTDIIKHIHHTAANKHEISEITGLAAEIAKIAALEGTVAGHSEELDKLDVLFDIISPDWHVGQTPYLLVRSHEMYPAVQVQAGFSSPAEVFFRWVFTYQWKTMSGDNWGAEVVQETYAGSITIEKPDEAEDLWSRSTRQIAARAKLTVTAKAVNIAGTKESEVKAVEDRIILAHDQFSVGDAIRTVVSSDRFVERVAGIIASRTDFDTVELVVDVKEGGVVKVDGQLYEEGVHTINVIKGETVSLLAMPLSGYSFVDWGGALTSSTASENLLMDENYSIIASFSV